MSRHTIEAEITITVEIEYEYEPGYPAIGPSYASGGEPGAAAEVSLIHTRRAHRSMAEVAQDEGGAAR